LFVTALLVTSNTIQMDESLPLQHELDELKGLETDFEARKTGEEEDALSCRSATASDRVLAAYAWSRNIDMARAMQRWMFKVVARRIYHQGPPDLLELIIRHCKDRPPLRRWMDGLNELRLVSKRCKQAVHAVSTKLRFVPVYRPPPSVCLPGALKECNKIESITFEPIPSSTSIPIFTSLEGCPASLKELRVVLSWEFHLKLSDLSPLSSCALLEKVTLEGTSIKDLSPLSSCQALTSLSVQDSKELSDLSPLLACTSLARLDVSSCPLLEDLTPLDHMKNLRWLKCLTYSESINASLLSLMKRRPEVYVVLRS